MAAPGCDRSRRRKPAFRTRNELAAALGSAVLFFCAALVPLAVDASAVRSDRDGPGEPASIAPPPPTATAFGPEKAAFLPSELVIGDLSTLLGPGTLLPLAFADSATTARAELVDPETGYTGYLDFAVYRRDDRTVSAEKIFIYQFGLVAGPEGAEYSAIYLPVGKADVEIPLVDGWPWGSSSLDALYGNIASVTSDVSTDCIDVTRVLDDVTSISFYCPLAEGQKSVRLFAAYETHSDDIETGTVRIGSPVQTGGRLYAYGEGPRPSQARSVRTLDSFDFETGSAGWETVDLLEMPCYWQHLPVDDTAAGVMWCGLEDASYSGGSGYGHNWAQLMTRDFEVATTSECELRLTHRYDTEAAYDFCTAAVSADSGRTYTEVAIWDGLAGAYTTDSVALGELAPGLYRLRLLFDSDNMWDDEDGVYPTDGAWHVDRAEISSLAEGAIVDDDFATGSDGWTLFAPHSEPVYRLEFEPPVGEDLTHDPTDYLGTSWVAYDPDLDAFPYVNETGASRSGVESPLLTLAPGAEGYLLEMDVYARLPYDAGMRYTWQTQLDDGDFTYHNWVYYSSVERGWDHIIRGLTPADATQAMTARLRLLAIDYGDEIPGNPPIPVTEPHTRAPYFDNVNIVAIGGLPVLAIDGGPADGGFVAADSVTFAWSAFEGEIPAEEHEYSWSLDGGAWSDWALNLRTVTLTGLTDGTHVFGLRATNTEGGVAELDVTFTVDTTPPLITLLQGPAPGEIIAAPAVSCSWFMADNLTAANDLDCVYVLDGGAPVSLGAGMSLDLTGLAAGPHTLEISVFDEAGNESDPPIELSFTTLLVDLVVTAAAVPDTAYWIHDLSVSWTVTNQGTSPLADGAWTDRIFLSRDQVDGDDILLAPDQSHDLLLGAGASQEFTAQFPLQQYPESTTWYLKIVLDADDQQPEWEGENNNVHFSEAFAIVPPPGYTFDASVCEPFDTLDAPYWQTVTWNSPGDFVVESEGGRLHLHKASQSGHTGVQGGGVRSNFSLRGDFSITVDYDFTVFPENNQAQINIWSGSFLYDMGTGRGIDVPTGEIVVFNFVPADGAILSTARMATSNTSGSFRLTRVGSTFTSYYRAPGSQTFTQIPRQINVTAADVQFGLILQNNGVDNISEVYYDNLSIEADIVVGAHPALCPVLTIDSEPDHLNAPFVLRPVGADYPIHAGLGGGTLTLDRPGNWSITWEHITDWGIPVPNPVYLDVAPGASLTVLSTYRATSAEDVAEVRSFRLGQAAPNPFNPQATIVFELPRPETVRLRVFDVAGRLVRTLIDGQAYDQGRHEAVWRGRDDAGRRCASDTYFYRLEAGSFSETKRMVLLK